MVLDFLTMNFMVSQIFYKTIRVQSVEERNIVCQCDTIQKTNNPFVNYLTRKANLSAKKNGMQDQDAPIILGDLKNL